MYANRENTLKAHRQTLTNVIIDWRRLELSSWRVLLDSQAKIYASETSTWWFRLYEACVYGALSAGRQEQTEKPEALSEYLDNLIPLLDNFMSSSSLGQFQARLQLLQSFERYLSFMKVAKSDQEMIFGRVQCVLYTTTQYFNLYSSNLAKILLDQKAGLEKDVQDFIRLASWKDTNVQALKASAQKTHHQLFKVIRKFREVLKQPIRNHLQPQPAGDAEIKQLGELKAQGTMDINVPGPHIDEDEANAKVHLAQLKRTFSRYTFLIATRIRPFIHTESARLADNLAIEVISTARELSSIVIPNGLLPEKREKQQKALVVRKRKAWSDLLKELKRAGLSPNPKASVLRNLADERWLREQAILSDEWKELPTDKIDEYFSRLRAMMPQLRASLANHHSDISTRDLGRGLMSLESGFWMAIDLRQR
jgi:midasin